MSVQNDESRKLLGDLSKQLKDLHVQTGDIRKSSSLATAELGKLKGLFNTTPQAMHEEVKNLFTELEKHVNEVNLATVDIRKTLLTNHATVCNLIRELLNVVVAADEATVAHHSTIIETSKARSANQVLRKMNSNSKLRLLPLQKEIPSGNVADGGIALANNLAPPGEEKWQNWPPLAMPLVGEVPPKDLFPGDKDALAQLTHANLLNLIAFYNESFGIALEDPLELRREKFQVWCGLEN